MEKKDYFIGDLYEPGYSSFHPSKDIPSINYKIPSGQIGMTLDPRMANQLKELNFSLNTGVVPIEIGTIAPQTFDQIPIQHFTEIKRKAKLADAKVSLHAPIQGMDPSGFTERGWDENNRQHVEKQLIATMDKAALLDDNGGVPVTIHGSNTGGSNWTFKGEGKDRKKVHEMLLVVDRETGEPAPLKEDTDYLPGGDQVQEKTRDPLKRLEILNRTKWEDSILEAEFRRENAEKILFETDPIFIGRYSDLAIGASKGYNSLEEKEQIERVRFAAEHVQESARKANNNFSKAYSLAKRDNNKEQLDYLNNLSKEYGKLLGADLKDDKEKMHRMVNPKIQSQALALLNKGLQEFQPKLYQSMEDFSIEKASETFSNVALHSYNKYKDKSPIVSIENLYPEMGFSQGEDLKNLVVKSRERFVEKAISNGLSESEAKSAAEKVIGVTFDVGHLNMNKKFGFTDKDLAKEAKEVAKYIKHVHLTDNFGHADSHLPLGMGNVPVKELLENLGEEGKKARKINEVGGWFEHFKTNPFSQLLESAGSPIYSSGDGPYWSHKTGFQQSYMEGYGMMLPQTHYDQFGSGFSRLPQSLGGAVGGNSAGGRMGGGRE